MELISNWDKPYMPLYDGTIANPQNMMNCTFCQRKIMYIPPDWRRHMGALAISCPDCYPLRSVRGALQKDVEILEEYMKKGVMTLKEFVLVREKILAKSNKTHASDQRKKIAQSKAFLKKYGVNV